MDQAPELQTDLGGWCCGVGSRQESWGSQSEEEGTAEKLSDPAAAELSLEGGSQGRGGGGGGKDIPQAFLAPDRDRGVK